MAKLDLRAASVTIARPKIGAKSLPDRIAVHIVHVTEPNPPDGVAPAQWSLLTSLPIDTDDQVAEAVDIYRARWEAWHRPNSAASTVLTELQIQILRRADPQKRGVSSKATVGHVMRAVARLGGHKHSNGDPGWLVTWPRYAAPIRLSRRSKTRPRARPKLCL